MKYKNFIIESNLLLYILLPVVSIFLPLTAILVDTGESLLSITSILCFVVVALLSIIPGILLLISKSFLRCIILTGLMVLTFYALYFPVEKPSFNSIPFGVYGVIFLCMLSSFPVMWLLRDNIVKILLVVVIVLWFGMLLTPQIHEVGSKVEYGLNNVALNKSQPRYIHIVLDQHIGVEGVLLNNKIKSEEIRNILVKQYTVNGFDVYGRAYSQYNDSLYSFPTFMNLSRTDEPGLFLKEKKFGVKLISNKVFDLLSNKNYRINLYQANYIDMCDTSKYDFNKCDTYTLNKLYDDSLDTRYKIEIIFNKLVGRYMLLGTWRRISSSKFGLALGVPKWPPLKTDVFASASLNMMKQLKNDVLNSKRGEAFFAHIYLPHFPYLLDRDCKMNMLVPEVQTEDDYFAQLECIQKVLADFILSMKSSNILNDSIVVVHGDHGSRIINPPPSLNSPPSKNYISWHSTFYAIHMPNVSKSEYYLKPMSISDLLREVHHNNKADIVKNNSKHVYITPGGYIAKDYKFISKLLPPFKNGEIVESW